jgi:hypothetical protein
MDAIEEVLKVAKLANSGSWGRNEYCALVALDVENAFNTASWKKIVTAMDAFGVGEFVKEMVQTYLTDRTLTVSGELRRDLAVMAMAATKEDLQNLVDGALERVNEWMRGAGLRLAARKTEAVLLTGNRRPGRVTFHLDGEEIVPRESIRYLGVRFDRNTTFGSHVEGPLQRLGGWQPLSAA